MSPERAPALERPASKFRQPGAASCQGTSRRPRQGSRRTQAWALVVAVTLWMGLGGDPARIPAAAPAWASGVGLPLSIPELVARADVIVVGVVVGMRSAWDATASVISTVVDVRPEEVLKGPLGAHVLRLRHLGGRVGDAAAVVAGAPTFVSGERVLLFLAGDPQGELAVVGLSQGKLSVTQDAAGRSVVRRTEAGARQEMSLEDARDLIRRAAGG